MNMDDAGHQEDAGAGASAGRLPGLLPGPRQRPGQVS